MNGGFDVGSPFLLACVCVFVCFCDSFTFLCAALIPPRERSPRRRSASPAPKRSVVKGPAAKEFQLSKGRGVIATVWIQVIGVLLLSAGSAIGIWTQSPVREGALVGFPIFLTLTWILPALLGLFQAFLIYFGVKANDAHFLKLGAQVSFVGALITGVPAIYGALVLWVLGPTSEFAAVVAWTPTCSYVDTASSCFSYAILVLGLGLSFVVHMLDGFVALDRSRTLRDMQTLHAMIETEEHYEWMRSLRNIFLNRSAPPPPSPPSAA